MGLELGLDTDIDSHLEQVPYFLDMGLELGLDSDLDSDLAFHWKNKFHVS